MSSTESVYLSKRDDGVTVAVVPDEYGSGELVFPSFVSASRLRRWQDAAKPQEGDPESVFTLDVAKWRSVCAIATAKLFDVDGKPVTNNTAFDEIDVRVLPWAFGATAEYLNPFLAIAASPNPLIDAVSRLQNARRTSASGSLASA